MIHSMALDRSKPNHSPPSPEENTQPLWLRLHTPRRLTGASSAGIADSVWHGSGKSSGFLILSVPICQVGRSAAHFPGV